jgi:hypothetical protein
MERSTGSRDNNTMERFQRLEILDITVKIKILKVTVYNRGKGNKAVRDFEAKDGISLFVNE